VLQAAGVKLKPLRIVMLLPGSAIILTKDIFKFCQDHRWLGLTRVRISLSAEIRVIRGFRKLGTLTQSVFGDSEIRSRRDEEADDLSKFHNPDPPPHLGGYIFQTGS
jgi:hypothetical protein